jgi:6-phosphogluconolactonase
VTALPPAVPDVPAAFTQTVQDAFTNRSGPRFTLVLSGGPTARACYEHLAAHATLDWTLVDIAMGDERVVAPTDPDANQQLVHEALLDRIGRFGSFTPMPTVGPIADCVARYQQQIAAILAGPGIDLIHLGMGPDGHTASLFPNAPTLHAGPEELVAATEDPNGRNPHPRLTLTLPAINSARCAVFTITGESKQEAVTALRDGSDIPASRIAPQSIIWLLDAAAAGNAP